MEMCLSAHFLAEPAGVQVCSKVRKPGFHLRKAPPSPDFPLKMYRGHYFNIAGW